MVILKCGGTIRSLIPTNVINNNTGSIKPLFKRRYFADSQKITFRSVLFSFRLKNKEMFYFAMKAAPFCLSGHLNGSLYQSSF